LIAVYGTISFDRFLVSYHNPHSQKSGQGLQAIKECRIAGISATGKEQRTSTNKMLTRDKTNLVDYVDLAMKTYDIV
jgi:hypothetical protein